MSDTDYQQQAREQSDGDLPEWTSNFRPGTYPRLFGELELQRRAYARQTRLTLVSLALSALSLLLALLAALL